MGRLKPASPGWLAAPLFVYLCIFYAWPLLAMMLRSVRNAAGTGFTLANFTDLLSSHVFWRVMEITGQISLISTIACLLLGYPVAYVLARQPVARANLLMILVLIPFWTSILIRTYAWMALLERRGIINALLLWTGAIARPLTLLNTRLAVCIAMVHVLLPFMVLPLYANLRNLDWRLVRAAEGLGARPAGVFRQVLLPLSLPGISAGCILVFTLAIGFYITPVLVGGPSDVMISILINDQVGLLNWPMASAMAVLLLGLVLLLYVGFTRVLRVEAVFQAPR